LDVPILCWALFPSFVAKESVQRVPIFGRLAQVMQCTFVSHGSSTTTATATTNSHHQDTSSSSSSLSATDQLIQRIRQHPTTANIGTTMNTGTKQQSFVSPPLIVFPEGTTTNGSYLIPFKSGVFAAQIKVQPILLHYHWTKFNPAWETIGMTPHLIHLLAQPTHRCTMTILPPIDPPTPSQITSILQPPSSSNNNNATHTTTPIPNTKFNTKDANGNAIDTNNLNKQQQMIIAKYFANQTRDIMSKVGNLTCSNHTHKDKLKYHNQLRSAGYT